MRVRAVLICLFLSALLLATTTAAQKPAAQRKSEQEPIKLSTTLVPVTFAVKDKKGSFIKDLKKEDFQVFEDGKEQLIAAFDTSPFFVDKKEPLAVALVLNWNSNTMRPHAKVAIAALANWQKSLPDNSVVAVFTGPYCTIQWFTSDRSLLQGASNLVADLAEHDKDCGFGRFYDAVAEAARRLKEVPRTSEGVERRKIIFIVSSYYDIMTPFWPDAMPSFRYYYARAWREISGKNISIYAAMPADSYLTWVQQRGADRYLERLFQDAGGKILNLDSRYKAPGEAFGNVFAELQHSYQLAYTPARSEFDGKFHKIKLRVKRPGLEIVGAREGYWAQRPEEAAKEKQAIEEAILLTTDESSDMPALKLKRRDARAGAVNTRDPWLWLEQQSRPSEDGVAPLRAELKVDSQRALADGTHKVDFSLIFDYQSLRVTRSGGSRVDRESKETWSWPRSEHSNLDIWIELLREGESTPISRLQRTLNSFVDHKLFSQYRHSGVRHAESLIVSTGRYLLRIAARETLTDRLVTLREVLWVSEEGVEHRSLASDLEEKEYTERLLDLLPAPITVENGTSSRLGREGSSDPWLSVALLVDAHALIRRKQLQTLASATAEFLPSLRQDDGIGVVAINDHATQVLDFTFDHQKAQQAMARILVSPSDLTGIHPYEAVLHTARQMMARSSGRRVLVWLTDLNRGAAFFYGTAMSLKLHDPNWTHHFADEDLESAPYDETLKAVKEADTTFYAIVLPNRFPKLPFSEGMRDRRKDKLRKLVESSGGRLIIIDDMNKLPAALTQIVREQRDNRVNRKARGTS